MNNIFSKFLKTTISLFGITVLTASCSYENIGTADYPEQIIYLPAAVNGIFSVSTVVTSGATKYVVDADTKKLNIPLGVSRSGVYQDGDFSVDIKANADTISKLISANTLLVGAELLPTGKYSIPATANVVNGQINSAFNLSIDLDFLRDNSTKKFAIGVSIASTQRKSNPKFSTVIVLLDASILKPTADFTTKVDAASSKNIIFTNISKNAVTYSWDFGDGSPASTLAAPTYTYAKAGTYTITLTATGITGNLDANKKTTTLTVL